MVQRPHYEVSLQQSSLWGGQQRCRWGQWMENSCQLTRVSWGFVKTDLAGLLPKASQAEDTGWGEWRR